MLNKKIAIIVLAFLVLIGGTLLTGYLTGFIGNIGGTKDVNSGYNLDVDSDAVEGGRDQKGREAIIDELNKKVAEGMINISMNLNPTFKTGKDKGNLLIINEKINNYPQFVEIYRDDTNELIYKSGLIPVGSKIESAQLNVQLPKGDYKCTAYFNAVNEDTKELIGKAGAKINIKVLG